MGGNVKNEILTRIILPLIIIVAISFVVLFAAIYRNQVGAFEGTLASESFAHSLKIAGSIDSSEQTVRWAAREIESLDPSAPDARKQVENAVKNMMGNNDVFNAWLVFEPNAFDNKDALFKDAYPGAPSGRFMLSYIKEDDKILTLPDMDETIVDDSNLCPWYTSPFVSKQFYLDMDIYDYKIEGADEVYSLSLVMPIFSKDNKVLGVVGADIIFDPASLGTAGTRKDLSIFYRDGRVFYTHEKEFAEMPISNLKFSSLKEIQQTIAKNGNLLLNGETSLLFDDPSYCYFCPINKNLYLMVAIPRQVALRPLFTTLALILAVFLLILLGLIWVSVFLTNRIYNPLDRLITSANNIAKGDLKADISIQKKHSAIGTLSVALSSIAEQLSNNLKIQQTVNSQFVAYMNMARFLNDSSSLSDAFNSTCLMMCKKFDLNRASVIYSPNGTPEIVACYERFWGFHEPDEINAKLKVNEQNLKNLTKGRDIVCLNKFVAKQEKLDFLDDETVYSFLLPMGPKEANGYICLESKNIDRNITSRDEGVFVYIAHTVSQWVMRQQKLQADNPQENERYLAEQDDKENPQKPPEPEMLAIEEEQPLIAKLKDIDGMNVETALANMGYIFSIYESSFQLFVRLLPETIEKIEKAKESGVMKNFAIEVHGLKGSLYNIGNQALAADASKLEAAAKAGDKKFCDAVYPAFKLRLEKFYEITLNIVKNVFKAGENSENKFAADYPKLKEKVLNALSYADNFDAVAVADELSELRSMNFPENISKLIEEAVMCYEAFDYEGGKAIIFEIMNETEASDV